MYIQSDTLLLADVFENLCLEIYELDPAEFFSAPGLAWQAALKKKKIKIRSFSQCQYVMNGRKIYLLFLLTFILTKLEFGFYKSQSVNYLHQLKTLLQINVTEWILTTRKQPLRDVSRKAAAPRSQNLK